MSRIRCECGQTFAAKSFDGLPRLLCPVCKRPVSPELLAEPLEAKVLDSLEPVVAELADAPITCNFPDMAVESKAKKAGIPGETIAGLWRDGPLLVVHRIRHTFPLRCVMSNEPVSHPLQPLFLDYLPHRTAWSLFGKSLGRAIGESIEGEQVILYVGIDVQWKKATAIRRVFGLIAVCTGAFMAIPATVLLSASRVASPENASGIVLSTIALTLAWIVMLGIGVGVLVSLPRLRVVSVQGDYAWIIGAHGDFLAALPPWPRR